MDAITLSIEVPWLFGGYSGMAGCHGDHSELPWLCGGYYGLVGCHSECPEIPWLHGDYSGMAGGHGDCPWIVKPGSYYGYYGMVCYQDNGTALG